jgi:hypothetical protein
MSRSHAQFRWVRLLPRLGERVVRLRPRRESMSVPSNAGQQEPAVAQRLDIVEKRLEHLEAMIEGLQDAVHRESVRQGKEIDQLQKSAEPGEIRRALGQDAREHGI